MTYEQFKEVYTACFKALMTYTPNEVGSSIYCEKMAKLADEYPDFAEKCESE